MTKKLLSLHPQRNSGVIERSSFVTSQSQTVMPDHATKHAIQIFLGKIALQYDIAGVVLFGSRARGSHRADSDADIAVLLRGEKEDPFPVVGELADTAFDVMIDTGILVQAPPIWLEDWEHPERSSNSPLVQNIQREGIAV